MRQTDPRQAPHRRRSLALALALLLPAGAASQPAPAQPPPRLCWQRPASVPAVMRGSLDDASPGELAATDGAHPVVWLTRAGVGQRRQRSRDRFAVGSNDPQLFLHWPGDAALSVWASERLGGIRQLTARVAGARPPQCADRGGRGGAVVVVEAVAETGTTACVAWPLGAAPGGGDLSRRTFCFPIAVPDLVGLPLAEAESILKSLDLLAGTIEQRPSREPATQVLSQDPPAGTGRELATGDPIDLVVAEQQLVRLPDLVGLEVGRAVAVLSPIDLGLVARSAGVEVGLDRVDAYTIDAQRPEAGSLVPVGAAAAVDVSLRLPDLRGWPLLEALSWLSQRGLSPDTGLFELPREPPETELFAVALHRPAAEETAQLGQTVEIGVLIAVPNLRGLSPAAARRVLTARALRLRRDSPAADDARAERIREQSPAAGERLPPGSEIGVAVGVLTPDIEGFTIDEAARRLAARRLELALTGAAEVERWRAESHAHRLAGQRPGAGTLVDAGTAVEADLAVQIPNLLWTSAAAADAKLRAVGLEPRRPRPRVARGSLYQRVVGQEPPPGSWLAAGGSVQLVLGPGLDPPPPRPQWPWRWLILIAALSASLLRPRKPPRGLRVEAHTDFGTQKLTAGSETTDRPAVRLRPQWDPGRQTIETSDKGGADA